MTRLAVVYDRGAVPAGEIATGLARLGEVTFVVPGSAPSTEMLPLLRELGEVVTDDAAARQFDAVLTFSKRMLSVAADLTVRLDLPGHDHATVVALTEKPRQRARPARSAVDTVAHHVVAGVADWLDALAAVGLPGILKARSW